MYSGQPVLYKLVMKIERLFVCTDQKTGLTNLDKQSRTSPIVFKCILSNFLVELENSLGNMKDAPSQDGNFELLLAPVREIEAEIFKF